MVRDPSPPLPPPLPPTAPPPSLDKGNLGFSRFGIWTQDQKSEVGHQPHSPLPPPTGHREFGILADLDSGSKVVSWSPRSPPPPPPHITPTPTRHREIWFLADLEDSGSKVGSWSHPPPPPPTGHMEFWILAYFESGAKWIQTAETYLTVRVKILVVLVTH